MRFRDLPDGACYTRAKGGVAVKTGAATCHRVDGSRCSVKATTKVHPSLCNIRPLIELGSVRRPT